MVKTTATDFKINLGKYLTLVGREDIYITKNGSDVAVLTAPKPKNNWLDEITGVIPNAEIDEKKLKEERLTKKYEGFN